MDFALILLNSINLSDIFLFGIISKVSSYFSIPLTQSKKYFLLPLNLFLEKYFGKIPFFSPCANLTYNEFVLKYLF